MAIEPITINVCDMETHVKKWRMCARCPIGEIATKHVFCRTVPVGMKTVSVLFIGEGPGEAEDVMGRPFVGPSGRLLTQAIEDAQEGRVRVSHGFTNLIACRPQEEDIWRNRQPTQEEIENCRPRLEEAIELLNPQRIVLLGKVPGEAATPLPSSVIVYRMQHPAYVLRCGGAQSSLYVGYVKQLITIFDDATPPQIKAPRIMRGMRPSR